MIIFKLIISSLLIGSLNQTVPDENGWVSLERKESFQEDFLEAENGVWVVFSKHFEGEKFQVRFPEDPSCQVEGNEIQMRALRGDASLALRVQKGESAAAKSLFDERVKEIKAAPSSLLLKFKESSDGKTFDLFFRSQGNWVWERIYSSSKLVYTFHTESPEMSGHVHRQFISSLDIL